MINKNINKISIISAITIALFVGMGFGIYKYNKVQAYNNLVISANKYMDLEDYDKALALFEQSLQYKKDSSVEKHIELIATLKKFKEIYNEGIKLVNDKKYLEAIEKFKTIDKSGLKWYTASQKKIEECKKQYILQNMQLANDAIKNGKYEDANKYLDGILKLDSNNADAKKLKDSIAKTIKEQQENANKVEETKQNEIKNSENINNIVKNNSNEVNSKQSELINKMKEIDNEIYVLKVQMQGMDGTSDEYINALQRQNELFKQKSDLLKQMQ